MMTDGPNRGVDPPFNYDMNSQDSLAGATQVPTQLETVFHFFDLHGPDCTVTVSEAMRVHMAEPIQVWMTLPDDENLILPTDGTLWLKMSICERAGRNNIHTAISYSSVDSSGVQTFYRTTPDPGQESNQLYPGTAFIFPIGDGVGPGSQIIRKNEEHLKLNFIGVSKSNISIRFQLCDSSGNVFFGGPGPDAPMENVRIFVTAYFWAERRT